MFYLYLRTNHWFESWKVLKVGIFGIENKYGRNQTYKTGEPRTGYFKCIWKINEDEKAFDEFLKNKLERRLYVDDINPGGTEFYTNYDGKLEEYIQTILVEYSIKHQKLNKNDIDIISKKNTTVQIYHVN